MFACMSVYVSVRSLTSLTWRKKLAIACISANQEGNKPKKRKEENEQHD